MKIRYSLVGLGSAFVVISLANAAQAQSCPTKPVGEGNVYQEEVSPGEEFCADLGGVSFTMAATDAVGLPYQADVTLEGGDEYLAVGDYVEVTIDLDTVMASIKTDEEAAVKLASDLGIRKYGDKSGIVNADLVDSKKLSEEEYSEVATYVAAALQNRRRTITGRSDRAKDPFTRRIDQIQIAIDRALDSLNQTVRDAMPKEVLINSREIHRDANGTVRRETTAGLVVRW